MDRIKKLMKAARGDYRKIKRKWAAAHDRHTKATGEKPEEFEDSSFLYIKSNDADNGTRPTAGPYYCSPSLNLYPNSTDEDPEETTTISIGKQYTMECIVHNGGDLDVPSAVVEFFLIEPSLARLVGNARQVGATTTPVVHHNSARVHLTFVAQPEDEGHRCLFARAYSFSPADYPTDFEALAPAADRHVAQQNLNFVKQAEKFAFAFDAAKKFKAKGPHAFRIEIRPLKALPRGGARPAPLRRLNIVKSAAAARFDLDLDVSKGSQDHVALKRTAANVWTGTARGDGFVRLELKVPDLGLSGRSARLFEINQFQGRQRKPVGGITLVVRK